MEQWIEHKDADTGTTYYHNTVTGASSWEKPMPNDRGTRKMQEMTNPVRSPSPSSSAAVTDVDGQGRTLGSASVTGARSDTAISTTSSTSAEFAEWYSVKRRPGGIAEWDSLDGRTKEVRDADAGGQGVKTLLQACGTGAHLAKRATFEEFLAQGGWGRYPGALISRFDLRNLGPIDTVNGLFNVYGYMTVLFRVPKETPFHTPASVPRPLMRFQNAVDGEEAHARERGKDLIFQEMVPQGSGIAEWQFEIRGSFLESFELNQFPFDVQDCSLLFAISTQICKPAPNTAHDEKAMNLMQVPFFNDPRKNEARRFWLPADGQLHMQMPLNEWYLLSPGMAVLSPASKKSIFKFSLRVRRKPKFYIVNIMIPISCISLLTFCSYLVPIIDVADRLSISLTLLLTAVAFKLVVAESLPKIAYMTTLDKYVYANFALILLVCIETFLAAAASGQHAWSGGYELPEMRKGFIVAFDRCSAIALFFLWLFGHVRFVLRVRGYIRRVHAVCGKSRDQIPLGVRKEDYETESLQAQVGTI